MEVLGWAIVSHIKEPRHHRPPENLRVAFLTTFVPQSESIELLEHTLPAMVAAHYKHDTWVLDEGNDPRVKALCEKLGVKHHSRHGQEHYNTHDGKFARKTKGGNHNSWHDQHGHNYDIVAQIDTDFIPSPNFLTKTLGYFHDPRVAFVGTPQIYGNTKDSLIARGAAQQTFNFYGPILRGLYGMNSTLLIGANHVLRVKALEDVDHYSAHITEDLLTGMKLHAKGWRSVYVHEALAIGEGPTSWEAYLSQQMRWAYGCIDILFRHSPRLLTKMKSRQRLYYFFLQQHYFSGLAMMLGVLGLGLYAFFGISTANLDIVRFVQIYAVVLLAAGFMARWIQRFNVRPRIERGFYWAGMIVSIAAWPIFFLALVGAIRGKKLTYKVTPKGDSKTGDHQLLSFRVFRIHLIIALTIIPALLTAYAEHRRSLIMLGWMVATAALLVLLPFVVLIHHVGVAAKRLAHAVNSFFVERYKFSEIKNTDAGWLPGEISPKEKYKYVKRKQQPYLLFSTISFVAVSISMTQFLMAGGVWLLPLWLYFGLTVIYFLVSLTINIGTKDFDIKSHIRMARSWSPLQYPTVDVFLPTAGESLNILRNTWEGVQDMTQHYKGRVTVYCLDDSASKNVWELAQEFGFTYHVRPDRGQFKKAGNLRHGFRISKGEFIAILDADFRPRYDFLNELLPYFYKDLNIGIVQSPQYFDVHPEQGWLERGAGAVQEFFYRFSQVSRQKHNASICVGSNAVYRRRALQDTGGTALIEHSEDVHTGFNVRMHGWSLMYVPIILAKGLCPANMNAFFKQQYRWCLGSMSLLSSKKFRTTKLSPGARLSYFSGFLYYIHTAISALILPVVPLTILIFYPSQLSLANYMLLLPSILFMHVVLPLWHDATYGMEAWSVRMTYSWAHLSALIDKLKGDAMQWKPTGSKMKADKRYVTFRTAQIIFNFIPAITWVLLASWRVAIADASLNFVPILLAGMYFLLVSAKVAFYSDRESLSPLQLSSPHNPIAVASSSGN